MKWVDDFVYHHLGPKMTVRGWKNSKLTLNFVYDLGRREKNLIWTLNRSFFEQNHEAGRSPIVDGAPTSLFFWLTSLSYFGGLFIVFVWAGPIWAPHSPRPILLWHLPAQSAATSPKGPLSHHSPQPLVLPLARPHGPHLHPAPSMCPAPAPPRARPRRSLDKKHNK